MNSKTFTSLLLAAITTFSTGAFAQRHDAPGSSHGPVSVSGSGVIKSIDASGRKITLEHETINQFKLEQATHEFNVKGGKTLGNLKLGDKVNFKLENSGQDLVVVQISKAAGGAPARATPATMPEAQMQGSDKAKAAAEAQHNAKTHGTSNSAKQPEAQMQGSDKKP
jgi:Cu/Ag efflux protein CusF